MCQLIVLTYCCAWNILGWDMYIGNLQFYGLVLRKSSQGDLLGNQVKNASSRAAETPCFTSFIKAVLRNSTLTIWYLLYILTAALKNYFPNVTKEEIKSSFKIKEKQLFTFIEQLLKYNCARINSLLSATNRVLIEQINIPQRLTKLENSLNTS